MKFVNITIVRYRCCRDLVGESKVFVEDEAKGVSLVGTERGVVYFDKLSFESSKKKLSFGRVES